MLLINEVKHDENKNSTELVCSLCILRLFQQNQHKQTRKENEMETGMHVCENQKGIIKINKTHGNSYKATYPKHEIRTSLTPRSLLPGELSPLIMSQEICTFKGRR